MYTVAVAGRNVGHISSDAAVSTMPAFMYDFGNLVRLDLNSLFVHMHLYADYSKSKSSSSKTREYAQPMEVTFDSAFSAGPGPESARLAAGVVSHILVEVAMDG